MAETTSTTSRSTRSQANGSNASSGESASQPVDTLISGAQTAAEVARQTAERAAARLPDAVAGAQVYARDTQLALNGMDDQTLIAGSTFSLGLGIGLFLSGAHRLLVAAALVPAGAMAMTLLGRQRSTTRSSTSRAKSS